MKSITIHQTVQRMRWIKKKSRAKPYRIIEGIGANAIASFDSFGKSYDFYVSLSKKLVTLSIVKKPIIYEITKQLYFSFYKNFSSVLWTSIVFGSLFIGVIMNVLKQYGLSDMTGDVVVKLFAVEIAPIITTMLLIIKSSLPMNVELAQMKATKEMDTLQFFNIDSLEYIFVPRVISGVISVTFLSYFFSLIMVISAFVFSSIFFEINLGKFIYSVAKSIDIFDIIIFFIKGLLIGLFIFTIPTSNGYNTSVSYYKIGSLISSGTLRLLLIIMIIEVLTLAIRFL